MERTTLFPTALAEKVVLKKILLISGIFSSILYVGMNVFIAMQDPAYSSASQTVSELSAIGAPTRPIWVRWSFVYTFLVLAFGWGVLLSAERNRSLRVSGWLVIVYGALGFGWPFAPMHTRDVLAAGGGTISDSMHIVFSIVTVSLMLASIGFSAAALGKNFRFYSILTIVLLITFGILTFFDSPNIATNLPTPWIGVWERINIGVFLLWVIVLAVVLLRKKNEAWRYQPEQFLNSGH